MWRSKMARMVPSPCQQMVRAAPLGVDLQLQSATGSGKTLAYLARLGTLDASSGGVHVVLVPTRELATQVAHVAAQFGNSSCPLLVCTPGSFLSRSLPPVRALVMDEFDRLVDAGFFGQLHRILSSVLATSPTCTLMAVSATFAPEAQLMASRLLRPGYVSICAPEAVLTPVSHRLVVYEPKFFFSTLLSLLERDTLIVFPTTSALVFFHRQISDPNVLCLHGRMNGLKRVSVFAQFQQPGHVLLSTDLAARGLDFPHLRRVVQVGFAGADPVTQFVHRGGRVGRLGQGECENILLLGSGLDSNSKHLTQMKLEMAIHSMQATHSIEPLKTVGDPFMSTRCLESLLSWFIERRRDLGIVGDEAKPQIVKALTDMVRSAGVVQPAISAKLAAKLKIDHIPGLLLDPKR